MKESCGCCKGVEKLTPASILNSPGLAALSYRVGTHASFLQTMKARLSNLELKPEDIGDLTGITKDAHRPLQALTTRDPSDPAIALLDAWALVGDVLAFYQERIANEGFLRTAVERLSILELARLIGYRLGPGVAASVFLAYTLEKDTAVEIPMGARSQSLPGPGELPQSFETSDKLEARAEWNTLQLRLTRPQIPGQVIRDRRPFYFKGLDTRLKPNDPLLIDQGRGAPTLLRVISVVPNQAAGHTSVAVQSWIGNTPAAAAASIAIGRSSSGPPTADAVAELRVMIDRFKGGEGFEADMSTATAQRVIGQLGALENNLASIKSNAELMQILDAALPSLREEDRLATEKNFTKLLPWIDSILLALESFAGELAQSEIKTAEVNTAATRAAMVQPARDRAVVASQSVNENSSSLGQLRGFIDDLEEPATQTRPSNKDLSRSAAGSFSPASDAWAKLLVTMRPGLRDVLYNAWQNLPVTAPAPARVYALRTRASVFGHNAPLKPITEERTGRVVGAEEWTMFRERGAATTERFNLNIRFANQIQTFTATITLTDEDGGTIGTATTGSVPLIPQVLSLTGIPNETLTLAVDPFGSGVRFTFNFAVRQSQLIATWGVEGDNGRHMSVTGEGNCLVQVESTNNTSSLFGQGNSISAAGTFTRSLGSVPTEEPSKISLDASYPEILPDSWAVVAKPFRLDSVTSLPVPPIITKALLVQDTARADYGMAAASTQLALAENWITGNDGFEVIRGTKVFAQSELLELAEEPIDALAEPLCGDRIELANLVSGLEAGRWLIVSGERADLKRDVPPEQPADSESDDIEMSLEDGNTIAVEVIRPANNNANSDFRIRPGKVEEQTLPGVISTELVLLGGVEQGYDPRLPGDKTHTTLLLAKGLVNCYKRDTVTIYGNVVKATHGETKSEVLGSGDGSQAMQQFALRQSPLTYLPAATPAGAESTLKVRVNDVLWHESDALVELGPRDRRYITRTDDKDVTTVIFGDGKFGARLPTSIENVKAVYRTGIGPGGNVAESKISTAVTKPLGVKSVINPLPATGGAPREDRDQARRNAPMAVMALDRLISVQDYEDFARTYAGIAKATSTALSDGRRQLVHLTIAGSGDIPIAATSDLFLNLRGALRKFGDPFQPLQVAVRTLKLLIISAKVRLLPDYLWEAVEPKIRAALLDKFSFDQRALGQDALPSEALSMIQAQTGVAYVDLDVFDAVDESTSSELLATLGSSLELKTRITADPARVDKQQVAPAKRILPAQLVYLSPNVPATLILTELTV